MRIQLLIVFFLSSFVFCEAQELFPNSEPASNIPKGALGVRLFDGVEKDIKIYRNVASLRLMYGILPKLSVYATASMSDHHDRNFPANLISHTHNGNQTTFSTGNYQRGVQYPYLFNGIYLYAKYRFLTVDGEGKHFRMAAYAEWSNVKAAHDEAEPNLLDDTKGFGGGLITTCLRKRFAVSLTTGFIIPGAYNGLSPDTYGGPMVPTEVQYGRAIKYDLSFGYLLLPFHYQNYKQTNLNLYVEFMGKSYETAKVTQYGDKSVPIQTPLLEAGNYVDISPGVQAIINSNLRIDLSVELPFINKSYSHFYPYAMIGIQRYFYFKKK